MNTTVFTKFLILLAIYQPITSKTIAKVIALSEFQFNSASVIPVYKDKKNNKYYAILSREAFGSDKGTYDAFGGSREANEKHPVVTASREFYEESIGLFGNEKAIRTHIDQLKDTNNNGNTLYIIANKNKHSVIYVTEFPVDNFIKNFYKARENATSFHSKEKDSFAIINLGRLMSIIADAKRDSSNKLILPIKIEARVFSKNGKSAKEIITLRPYMVSILQSFAQEKTPDFVGKHPRIRIYNS